MARFKDIMPAQQGWIHELARMEIHSDAERLLQLGSSFDPQQLVEESTINFLSELREHFSEYARVFNAFSENNSKFQEIKIYGIAQTPADFMIFRNQIKLVVSHAAHGMIQMTFAQHVRSALAVDGQVQITSTKPLQNPAFSKPQEFLAQVGPFRDVYWTFEGEKINPEQVAKFYFSEFARVTRDDSRSRAGNQLLIHQIKALLQEKGLDL